MVNVPVTWPGDKAARHGVAIAFLGGFDQAGAPLRSIAIVIEGGRFIQVPHDVLTVDAQAATPQRDDHGH